MPREPQAGRCETCVHWDDAQHRKVVEFSAGEHAGQELDMGDFFDGECREIQHALETTVLGDGYLEMIETPASWSCPLHKARTEASDGAES